MRIQKLFLCLTILSVQLFMGACSSNSARKESDEQAAPAIPGSNELEFITVDGIPVYSLKYNERGQLSFYGDLLYNGFFEIGYNPLNIKISYYTPATDNTEECLQVVEMYDIQLNNQQFVSDYKTRSYDLVADEKKNLMESSGTVTYDSNGRMTELKEANGRNIVLEWDEEGNLIKSINNNTAYFFQPSISPNTFNQWVPMWYAVAGYEMTGLFGNAPSSLIRNAVQYNKDSSSSTALFNYHLEKSHRISSVDVQMNNGMSTNMVFEYTE